MNADSRSLARYHCAIRPNACSSFLISKIYRLMFRAAWNMQPKSRACPAHVLYLLLRTYGKRTSLWPIPLWLISRSSVSALLSCRPDPNDQEVPMEGLVATARAPIRHYKRSDNSLLSSFPVLARTLHNPFFRVSQVSCKGTPLRRVVYP